MPRVAILIVTYNSSAEIGGCLDALTALSETEAEILVVDNASADSTRDEVTARKIRLIANRTNAGFAVPIGAWLRGPLRDWAEACLAAPRLHDIGIDPPVVAALWASHLGGRQNNEHYLWNILMLSAWLEHGSQAGTGAERVERGSLAR